MIHIWDVIRHMFKFLPAIHMVRERRLKQQLEHEMFLASQPKPQPDKPDKTPEKKDIIRQIRKFKLPLAAN